MDKQELRDKLRQDTERFLQNEGIIKQVKAPQKKRRKKSGNTIPSAKASWSRPNIKSSTDHDLSKNTSDSVESTTKSCITCTSPGKAAQLASVFANKGIRVARRGTTLFLKGTKAQQKAQKTTELQQLLSGE